MKGIVQKLAIENMRGGRMSKIILEFENPFWKRVNLFHGRDR